MLAVAGETDTETAPGVFGGGFWLVVLDAEPQEASAIAISKTKKSRNTGRSLADIVSLVSSQARAAATGQRYRKRELHKNLKELKYSSQFRRIGIHNVAQPYLAVHCGPTRWSQRRRECRCRHS